MNRFVALLAAAMLLLALTGCYTLKNDEPDPAYTTRTVTTHSQTALVKVSLKDILTRQKLTELVDRQMEEPSVLANGTQLIARSTDSEDEMPVLLTVNLDERTRDRFDAFVEQEMYPGLTEISDVGEVAYWSEQACVVLLYAKNHMMEVNLTCIDRDAATLQQQAIAIANALVEGL